jgi:hypothetical protein
VAVGDVVVSSPAAAAVEAAKARSIARGVAMLGAVSRDAGDIRAGTANGVPPGVEPSRWWGMSERERDAWFDSRSSSSSSSSSNAETLFDPTDPAAMTEARWRRMSEAERRDWINANVRDSQQRAAMIQNIATGVFDTVRDFVRTERETRLAEIRETASTNRERIRADLDAERARLEAETQRARIAAETARAEADRATADATRARTEAERVEREAAAQAARERAATAQATADRAAADRAAAEAAAARERWLSRVEDEPAAGAWSTLAKVATGCGVLLVLALGARWIMQRNNPPPMQYRAPQFPAYAGA